ncbi:MAG: DUF1294 domain-containing protein [Bacteroidales bacterium]|nr:DUF1294 domain-containing protein [Candidatus Sodaliphilus fimicaballi]
MTRVFLYYIVFLTVVTFITYGIDKFKAIKHKRRISEATLLLLAATGGSLGAWLGMWVWHHKTLHKKFYIGVPAIIFAQIATAVWICIGFD